MSHQALIIVDLQNDFCPGGSLAVSEGDQIIPVIHHWIERLSQSGDIVVTTQDAHPANHMSFREQGGPWPSHCVKDTWGFQLHPRLELPAHQAFYKGYLQEIDAYSGFEGTLAASETPQSLEQFLRNNGVDTLYVGGLATDYCVKATVLDALNRGFATHVIVDAVRGVNLNPSDSQDALALMVREGARLL